MNDIKEDLYDKPMALWDMVPVEGIGEYGPAGQLFAIDGEQGTGEYWAYFHENLFAIDAYDMRFSIDGTMRERPIEHLSLTYCDIVQGFEIDSGAPVRSGRISVYLAADGQEYLAHYEAGGRIRAVSITISPDYYRGYLQKRFGAIEDVRRAGRLIDGRRDIPELALLLKRVRAYRGEGMAASLFYEGAVAEAVALTLKKAQEITLADERPLSCDDERRLDAILDHVNCNLASDLSVATLAARAYIGQTKLKQLFKTATGLTPSEYVTRARMDRAMELLTATQDSVAAIAREVGYANPGAFSAAFRRYASCSPSDFR